MKKLGTAEGLAHFHRQGLLNQAERDRMTRAAITNSAARQRRRFSISRLFVALGSRRAGQRASTARASVPPRSA